MPIAKEDLPRTLKNSSKKAQETYAKTLDAAHENYPGDEERAHRVALASLKHNFEKVGDKWVPKREKGPSDPRAAVGGRSNRGRSAGGVDVFGHTRDELVKRARRAGVTGYSRMNKTELGRAIASREGARARRKRR